MTWGLLGNAKSSKIHKDTKEDCEKVGVVAGREGREEQKRPFSRKTTTRN